MKTKKFEMSFGKRIAALTVSLLMVASIVTIANPLSAHGSQYDYPQSVTDSIADQVDITELTDLTELSANLAPWNASTVYWGGDLVYFEGHMWRAQWWTLNERPGTNMVWVDLGPVVEPTPTPTPAPTPTPVPTPTPAPTPTPVPTPTPDPGRPLPPPGGYFIAITTDDGPHDVYTYRMLNVLRDLNNRPEVVCGMNGVLACVPGEVGRYGECRTPNVVPCGTVSRAHISFYVQGTPGVGMTGWWPSGIRASVRTLMRRMVEEGHSVENHTMDHNINAGNVRQQIRDTDAMIRDALHGQGPVTDFYGNVWSNSNPYPIFSFRPNNLRMNAAFRGVDEEFNQPWIFTGLDTGDWISAHTSEMMADWLINGRFNGVGPYTPESRNCPCTFWCPLRETNPDGAANGGLNGGIILIHDTRQSVVDFVELVVPQMQEMGYHFVTIEQLYTYLDAEWAWISDVPTIRPGDGYGTRINDWVIPGARRDGPIRPDIRP